MPVLTTRASFLPPSPRCGQLLEDDFELSPGSGAAGGAWPGAHAASERRMLRDDSESEEDARSIDDEDVEELNTSNLLKMFDIGAARNSAAQGNISLRRK